MAPDSATRGRLVVMDTCRHAVLAAMSALARRHGREVFAVAEIVQEVMATSGGRWQETTVRTHVTAHMCLDAARHLHADLDRVDRGLYRLAASNPRSPGAATPVARVDGYTFERHAARVLGAAWNVELSPGQVTLRGAVRKKFDLVSTDGKIVGDAKYYKNLPTPAAKWSTIAEYVWLLQHIDERARRFIVFGNDREVPARWLDRFRPLANGVEFWFLAGETFERL